MTQQTGFRLSGKALLIAVPPAAVFLLLLALVPALRTDNGDGFGVGKLVGITLATLIAAAVAYVFAQWTVRDKTGRLSSRAALVMAIAAAVTLPLSWTGVPFVLAGAAIGLALQTRHITRFGQVAALFALITLVLAVLTATT